MKMLSIICGFLICIGGCLEPTTGKTTSSGTKDEVVSNNEKVSESNSNAKVQYVIFGRFCGRCLSGKCAPMYKVDVISKNLSLDNSNHYSEGSPLTFNVALGAKEFMVVEGIQNKIPATLFSSKETKYGCPNCADQCGIYVEFQANGKKYSFELDNDTQSLSGDVKIFAEELQRIIASLQAKQQLTPGR